MHFAHRMMPALLLVPVLVGCKDPTGGTSAVASVTILSSSVAFEERTIGVGDVVQLTASPRDASNRPVEGRTVEWSSSAPGVASVDAGGVVRGVSLGTAWIRAATDGVRDSARINVSERFSGNASCAPGQTPISLAVGGVHVVSAYDVPTLCVAGGASGSDYVLVPHHSSGVASDAAAARLVVELTASGTLNVPLATDRESQPHLEFSGRDGGMRADDEFHIRLRERTLPELRPRQRRMHEALAEEPSFSSFAASPTVGQVMQLNVRTDSACAAPVNRAGRVVAISGRAVVVADESNPAGGFTPAEYAEFGARFDDLIYPLATQHFGEPHDLDGNQRVIIFFTRAVNDLTTAGSGFYIGGFFFDRDLFPRTGTSACAGSNAAEILYLMVPDPQRGATERAFLKDNVARRTLAVIGHELQHLINASRRLHVQRSSVWEEMWLNEGLSHIMEELLFYRVSGLQPRANLGSGILQTHSRTFEEYQMDNFERLIHYLGNPSANSLMAGNTLALRGAAWSFLRYAADRRAGTERDLWFALANSRTSGMANLRSVIGADVPSWIHDWSTSLFSDDHRPTETRFQQPSWNSRSIVPATRAMLGHGNTSYPLAPAFLRPTTEPLQPVTVSLFGGGSSFHRFGVAPGDNAAIRVSSGGLQAPSKLRVALIRTR